MAQPGPATRRKPRFRERNAARPVPREQIAPVAPAPPPPTPPAPAPRSEPRSRRLALPSLSAEQGLYLGILIFAFGIRIWDVGSRAMHGDESIHAWMAWRLFT